MICGYTTFELERVPVRERWDRVRARAVASRRDARDDTIARRTTLVPTVRKRARAWLAKLGSRGGDRRRRVGAVGEYDARVSSEARASLETHRHGPAPVPREDSSHALGHRLARPEVLLDAGPGRLSRARDARAIHRGAHAVPAEKRGATPRKIRPAASTPRRTKCARSRQVCQESERRKATKKRRCEFSSSACGSKTPPTPRARSGGFSTCFLKRNVTNRVFQYFHTACAKVEQKCRTQMVSLPGNTTPRSITT